MRSIMIRDVHSQPLLDLLRQSCFLCPYLAGMQNAWRPEKEGGQLCVYISPVPPSALSSPLPRPRLLLFLLLPVYWRLILPRHPQGAHFL